MTSIGDGAFQGCSLTSITIPSGVTSIGDDAFAYCSSLTSITIPSSVTVIGSHAFSWCSSLTSVTIPEGVTWIGWYAFSRCSSLTSITIPASVTSIGGSAFEGCYLALVNIQNKTSFNLEDYGMTICVEQGDGLLIKNNVAVACRKWAKSVTIPSNVTSIGNYAFRECSSLTSVTIPEGVTSIGEYAFDGCSSLTSITIPSSVTSIGFEALLSGSSLADVICLATNPPKYYIDGYQIGTTTIHVLPGCRNAYKAAEGWQSYSTIVEDAVIPDKRDQVVASNTADATITFSNTGTYEWAWDASGQRLMSTNKGIDSSTSQTAITINTSQAADFSFDYAVSSERNYDELTITLDGTTLVNAISGMSSSSKTQRLTAGAHTMVVQYVKDDSQDHNDDRAYVSNFRLEKVYNNYNLTFTVDGEQYHHITVEEGSSITLPEPPTKDGYIFKGWEGLPEDMLMPSNDLTVTAIFEEIILEDTDIAALADAVYARNQVGSIGSQMVLPIQMKNSIEATGFQADLVLPEGITVVEDEDGFPMVELSTQRTTATKTNMFDYSYQADGSLRIVCNSTKGSAFTGNDGEVALVTLNISEEIEEGDYPIIIKNIVITDAQGIDKKKVDLVKSTLTLGAYTLGDVNGDNEVDVADISSLSSYILGRVVPGFVEKAADLNEDTEIDVADISALAYLILHPETAQKAKARKVAEKKENIENTYNTLYAEILQAEAGTDVVLPIMMRNSIEATGFQLDLVLPEGVTLKEAVLSNARTSSKRTNLFDYAHQADGTYRILCNSTKGLCFNGHDGEVMLLTLHIDKDAELGAQTIALKDMVLTDATGMLREESSLSESTLWVGNATGIHEMASEKSAPAYDLQGRQVSKKQKGIHIQNGKKTVVK